jgi:hypothetical protein
VALALAGYTFWYTTFYQGKFALGIGPTLMLQITNDGRFRLQPEITIENPGAATTLVNDVRWTLQAPDGSSQKMTWENNVTTVYDQNTHDIDTRFDSWPGALVVPKDGVISKRMGLLTPSPYMPVVGIYTLTVTVKHNGKQITGPTLKISVNSNNVTWLPQNQLQPGKLGILLEFTCKGESPESCTFKDYDSP